MFTVAANKRAVLDIILRDEKLLTKVSDDSNMPGAMGDGEKRAI